jgi:hypothetical protein
MKTCAGKEWSGFDRGAGGWPVSNADNLLAFLEVRQGKSRELTQSSGPARIKTPERGEDVALLGWRTVGASGFVSGGNVPAYDANGFRIVKDSKDPYAAYGSHEIKPANPR